VISGAGNISHTSRITLPFHLPPHPDAGNLPVHAMLDIVVCLSTGQNSIFTDRLL
jgi:hypothetical protein